MSEYTPERINAMLWSKSLVPEPLQRDPCVNYFEGYFAITLTVKEKAPDIPLRPQRNQGDPRDVPDHEPPGPHHHPRS